MVTSGVASVHADQVALANPETAGADPAIGARMVAYCRLSRACSTAAWLPARFAAAAAATVRACSYCWAVT